MDKIIENQESIDHLFRYIAREKTILAIVNKQNKPVELTFGKKGCNIFFTLNDTNITDEVEIKFIFKDCFYSFISNVSLEESQKFKAEKPKIVQQTYKRFLTRYDIDDDAYLIIPDFKKPFKVKNLTTNGLAFISEDYLFDIDMSIRNAELVLDSEKIILDLNIEYISHNNQYEYGISYKNTEWSDFHKIFSYIFSKIFPNLRQISDCEKNELYKVFNESGYFNLDLTEVNIDKELSNLVKNYEKINKVFQLSFNPGYYENELLSTSSHTRIYENTFLGHHLTLLPKARRNLSILPSMYLCISEFLLSNPIFKNYLAYFDENISWHKEFFNNASNFINDKNLFIYDSINMFSYNLQQENHLDYSKEFSIEILDNINEFIDYSAGNLPELEVNSYSYSSDINTFYLNNLKKSFEIIGFYVDRRPYKIKYKNTTIAYAIAESYTSGLNLYNVFDSCRIYLVNNNYTYDINNLFKTVLIEMNLFYKKYNKSTIFLMFKPDSSKIKIDTLNLLHTSGRVMMSLEGMKQYSNYIKLIFCK